jgi:DNA-binding transcriptional ArsR family regulator
MTVKMFSIEELEQLSSKRKESHISRIIKELLRKTPNGITVSQIKETLKVSRNTIEKHLTELVAMNFAYRKFIAPTFLYYPNSRTMHPISESDFDDKKYSFFLLENDDGRFVYIQEKKRDTLNALHLSGGILVREQFFHDFVRSLEETNKKIKVNATPLEICRQKSCLVIGGWSQAFKDRGHEVVE